MAFGIIFMALFRGEGPGKRCIGMAWRGGSASVAHLHGMVYDDDCDRIGNKNFGYYMVLFIAGLQGIPEDLYEAASLDGANMWKKFKYITLPMLSPTTFLCTVMCLINSFKVFDLVNIMTDGGPGRSSNVLVYRIYQEAFRNYDFGYASAYAVVLFLIVFVITLIQFRGQKKWVNY